MPTLSKALKEWAVAVEALLSGQTIALLRKGGIREAQRQFTPDPEPVILFPTWEHQKPDLVEPRFSAAIVPVPSGWHPQTVTLKGWAQITHQGIVADEATALALVPHLIWNQQFVLERLRWKPHKPLYLLLLRAYRLPAPVDIPFDTGYGGCRSWIDLNTPCSTAGSEAVLTEQQYDQQAAMILAHLPEAATPL